jgi:hypothetical protein
MKSKQTMLVYLLYILMTLSPPFSMAELVVKPVIGYGTADLGSLALGPFYGGQTGFSADIGLGKNGLLSLFGSLDTSWWQEPASWRASGQGGIEASLLQGLWTYRSGLSGTFSDDPLTNSDPSGTAQLQVTAIRNGYDVSLQFDGSALFAFGLNYDTKYSGSISASLLWGELVVKPAFALSGAYTASRLVSWELGPKLGLSWYPSFPVSLDLSLLYHRDITNAENTLHVLTDLALQPLPKLGFSFNHGAFWTNADYTGSAGGELRINLVTSRAYNSWYFVSGSLGYTLNTTAVKDWNIKTGIGFQL